MKGLAGYLKKFTNLQPPERTIRSAFIESVQEVCGITLKEHEVSFSYQTAFLSCNPIIKSEIFLNKGAVLRLCKEKLLGKDSVRDVR